MAIRVFLVDDHALVRTGMRMLLHGADGIEVVGEAASGEEALPLVRRLQPDVVLCDLHLPGLSGLEVTVRLVRSGIRVVVVSVLEGGPMPRRLIEAGACGYVGKGGDAGELVRAVHAAAQGRRFLSSSIATSSSRADNASNGDRAVSSPDSANPCAMLLVRGLRQEDIARRLSLSAKTINTHKSRLFDKLGIRDSIALARMAGHYGLTEPM